MIVPVKADVKAYLGGVAIDDYLRRLEAALNKIEELNASSEPLAWVEQYVYMMSSLVIHEGCRRLDDCSMMRVIRTAHLRLAANLISDGGKFWDRT